MAAGQQSLSTNKEEYEGDGPVYKQPVEVGSFSFDSERRFRNDTSQMRYYVQPGRNPKFNLRDGYEDRYVKGDQSVHKTIDHLLRWVLENRSAVGSSQTGASPRAVDADFVTCRGNLKTLLTTPYKPHERWLLAVTMFKGTLYISKVEIKANDDNEGVYWGYKFEQYMCADDVDGLPDPSGVVNTNEDFYTVVKTRLSDHRLLFSGEVDCRDKDPKAPPPSCYVELKTFAVIRNDRQCSNFHRFKLLDWWAQSFLLGVPRVVVGFRDDNGVVVEVKTYPVSKIPQKAKTERNCWEPTGCLNFCCDFLSFVKRTVTEDNPSVVYLFSREPNRDVTFTVHEKSPYCFLPHWYVEEINGTQH